MRIAIQIPIKANSTRIPNKNFIVLRDKPLYAHLLDRLDKIPEHFKIDIWIDCDSISVFEMLEKQYPMFNYYLRPEWLGSNSANGNHLINNFSAIHPEYEAYGQLFVTAVNLTLKSILNAVYTFIRIVENGEHDSLIIGTEANGFYWKCGSNPNYSTESLDGLPRAQDMRIFKESTGLYLVTRNSLRRTGCRVGKRPLLYRIPAIEAVDIDTPEDLILANSYYIR